MKMMLLFIFNKLLSVKAQSKVVISLIFSFFLPPTLCTFIDAVHSHGRSYQRIRVSGSTSVYTQAAQVKVPNKAHGFMAKDDSISSNNGRH